MRSGLLRNRIEIQKPKRTRGSAGASDLTFVHLAFAWASITSRQGTETLRGDTQVADATHIVTIRYRDDISAGQRILFQNRTFEVTGAPDNVDERRRELRIPVNEVT